MTKRCGVCAVVSCVRCCITCHLHRGKGCRTYARRKATSTTSVLAQFIYTFFRVCVCMNFKPNHTRASASDFGTSLLLRALKNTVRSMNSVEKSALGSTHHRLFEWTESPCFEFLISIPRQSVDESNFDTSLTGIKPLRILWVFLVENVCGNIRCRHMHQIHSRLPVLIDVAIGLLRQHGGRTLPSAGQRWCASPPLEFSHVILFASEVSGVESGPWKWAAAKVCFLCVELLLPMMQSVFNSVYHRRYVY